jgi:hypothetical protein
MFFSKTRGAAPSMISLREGQTELWAYGCIQEQASVTVYRLKTTHLRDPKRLRK